MSNLRDSLKAIEAAVLHQIHKVPCPSKICGFLPDCQELLSVSPCDPHSGLSHGEYYNVREPLPDYLKIALFFRCKCIRVDSLYTKSVFKQHPRQGERSRDR